MTRSRFLTLVGVLVLAAFLPACSNSPTSPSTTTPTTTTTTSSTTTTTTTTTTVTETFESTLTTSATNYHVFHTLAGTVTTTLSALEPSAFTVPLGLGVGTWDGNSCTVVVGTVNAGSGTVLVGTATTEIDLCVKVYDLGNLAPGFTLSYQVTVLHQGTKS